MSDAGTGGSGTRKVGFIGLGNMGRPMARNLLAAGYRLTVHDVLPGSAEELLAEGAAWAGTAAQVASAADVIFLALPGPREVNQAVEGADGILAGSRPGTYVIDVSTNSPQSIRSLAAIAAKSGVHVLDAPMSGGIRGARKGTLTIMVGAELSAFEYCEPLLRVLGENVIHLGPLGSGHVAKLVNNYMGISNAIASMEAMAIGAAAGVDPEKLLEVVNLGTGTSHMTRTLYPYLIFTRNFDPVRFSMELAVKDVSLALDLAAEVGLTTKVGQATLAALVWATEQGLAGTDMSRYITLLEKATGVEVHDRGEAS